MISIEDAVCGCFDLKHRQARRQEQQQTQPGRDHAPRVSHAGANKVIRDPRSASLVVRQPGHSSSLPRRGSASAWSGCFCVSSTRQSRSMRFRPTRIGQTFETSLSQGNDWCRLERVLPPGNAADTIYCHSGQRGAKLEFEKAHGGVSFFFDRCDRPPVAARESSYVG